MSYNIVIFFYGRTILGIVGDFKKKKKLIFLKLFFKI